VATDEITWSEELYRILEVDRGVPATLELIVTRLHPEDIPSVHDMIGRARAAVSDFEFEHRLQMPDQSVRYLHVVAHGFRARDGQPEYIGAVQDVTEHRHSAEALSLSICHSIIESHGGRIWVSAVVGGGSIFQFELPVMQGAR